MHGIEFIINLCGFSAAIILLVGFSGTMNNAMNSSASILELKSESQKCAFIADLIYANSVEELLGKKLECIIVDGVSSSADEKNSRSSALLNNKTKTVFTPKGTVIKVNSDGHYR